MENVIEVTDLVKNFGSKQALSGVSFTIGREQIFGCLGPNGAGKTTTIRLILGLLKQDRGSIRIFDEEVNGKNRDVYRRIGFMLHDPGLYDELSCYQNLYYYADLYGVGKKRIEELLMGLDLWDKRDENVDKFSRGMKQKVVLARALLHDPDFLVLDEPATGLDPEMQVWMRKYIRELARDGKTIFLSSHNLFEVQQICSHIGVMYKGKLLKSGSIEEMRKKLSTTTVEVEVNDAGRIRECDCSRYMQQYSIEDNKITACLGREEDIPAFVKWLAGENFQILNINRKVRSVEDLYLELIDEARQ